MAKTEKSERVLCMLQAIVHSENVMLNRICILFKLGTYGLFLVSSRRIDLTSAGIRQGAGTFRPSGALVP